MFVAVLNPQLGGCQEVRSPLRLAGGSPELGGEVGRCLSARMTGELSPCVGRSEECAQGFVLLSHIHSGLIQ